MRIRVTIAAAGLLAMAAGPAMAQSTTPQPAPSGWVGSIDFGGRARSITGDTARFERYVDLRDGASTRITVGKETDEYVFDARLDNIGYRDQRYQANYDRHGRVKFSFQWDSIPMNYAYNTSTPWVEKSPGVFTLDRAARLLVQNATAGVVGVPTTAAQLLTPSIYRGLGTPFGIQARRDTASFSGTFMAARDVAINVGFTSTGKTGHEPKGASFAFSVAGQLPSPLDNRTNDLTAAVEWLKKGAMLRVAYDGSWFSNGIHEIVFDNPVRADDTSPYDSSGYSNGRGAAFGRIAAPPSNSLNSASVVGLYKLPGRSRSTINGSLSFTSMNQNDTLIPWTSNSVIAGSAVVAKFPGLANLPRSTAEAKVRGVNAVVNYTARPWRRFGFTTRYRYNDRQNLTPVFDAVEYVRLDAVPEETGGETEPFNIKQNRFDANGTFNLQTYTNLTFGYTLDNFKRTERDISDSTDHTFRTTLDTVAGPYVMLKFIYEHSKRSGTGELDDLMTEMGFQPATRTYDVADRSRNRAWAILTVTPAPVVDFSFSVAAARDRFNGPGHEFGLLNNDNTVFNVGVDLTPASQVRFGANYGRDTYSTLQESRNASPLGADYGSWTDPNRNWSLNGDEKVNNATIYVDLLKVIARSDIRFTYDYSDSNNRYLHDGPRIQELRTATALTPTDNTRPCAAGLTSCFEALPPVTNKWQRFMVDARHMFTGHVGIGIGYFYEKFDVSDYATIDLPGQPGTPRIDYLGLIGTGYGNRPYKASTGFVRVLYVF